MFKFISCFVVIEKKCAFVDMTILIVQKFNLSTLNVVIKKKNEKNVKNKKRKFNQFKFNILKLSFSLKVELENKLGQL